MASRYSSNSDKEYINYHSPIPLEDEENVYRPPLKKRHFGNNLVFCYFKDQPLFNIGPDWRYFLFSFFGIELMGIFVYFIIAPSQPLFVKLLILGLIVLDGCVFLYTGLRNPGIASAVNPSDPKLEELEMYSNFCKRCRVLRDESTYHCDKCDVCIKGYDHHCPWTGKCIGVNNFKAFYTFICVTFIHFAVCIILLVRNVSNE